MRLKRRYRHSQPVGERQLREESVELSRAFGPIEADSPYAIAGSLPSPQPDEIPLTRQLGCSRRLGLHAAADLGLRRSSWNLEIELDEELGHVGRSVPACSATMYAAYQEDQSPSSPERRWAASARLSAPFRSAVDA